MIDNKLDAFFKMIKKFYKISIYTPTIEDTKKVLTILDDFGLDFEINDLTIKKYYKYKHLSGLSLDEFGIGTTKILNPFSSNIMRVKDFENWMYHFLNEVTINKKFTVNLIEDNQFNNINKIDCTREFTYDEIQKLGILNNRSYDIQEVFTE